MNNDSIHDALASWNYLLLRQSQGIKLWHESKTFRAGRGSIMSPKFLCLVPKTDESYDKIVNLYFSFSIFSLKLFENDIKSSLIMG